MRDRVDEADQAAALGPPPVDRRLPRIGWPERLERAEFPLEDHPHLGSGEHPVVGPGGLGIEWHELDEPEVEPLPAAELGQRHDLMLGEPADRDGVDPNVA